MKRLIWTLLIAAPALGEVPCPPVVGETDKGTFRTTESTQCFATVQEAINAGFGKRKGCCSRHKGVASCDAKRKKYRCRDRTISPTCKCTPPKRSKR